jgi:hypothetical protein
MHTLSKSPDESADGWMPVFNRLLSFGQPYHTCGRRRHGKQQRPSGRRTGRRSDSLFAGENIYLHFHLNSVI